MASSDRLREMIVLLDKAPNRYAATAKEVIARSADEMDEMRRLLKALVEWSAAYRGNPGFDNARAEAAALIGARER